MLIGTSPCVIMCVALPLPVQNARLLVWCVVGRFFSCLLCWLRYQFFGVVRSLVDCCTWVLNCDRSSFWNLRIPVFCFRCCFAFYFQHFVFLVDEDTGQADRHITMSFLLYPC